MSEELKSCPFCGGEADIHHVADGAHAQCYDCQASSEIFDGSTDGAGRDRERAYEHAFEAWNRRTADQHIERLTSALERCAECDPESAMIVRAAVPLPAPPHTGGEQ